MTMTPSRRFKRAVDQGYAPRGPLFHEGQLIDRVRHLLGQKHGVRLKLHQTVAEAPSRRQLRAAQRRAA